MKKGHQSQMGCRSLGILCVLAFLAGCGERDNESVADIISVRTLGLAYLEENRLPEAESEFLKLTNIAPNEPLGHANLGLVYLRMGRFGDAEEQLVRALQIDERDPDVRLMLATVYGLSERDADQRRTLEETLQFAPDHVKTLHMLADLSGEASEAPDLSRELDLRGRVVARVPANIAARLQLIETLLRSEQSDSALMHMEEVRRQVPELPAEATAPFEAGLVAMRGSRLANALSFVRAAHNILRVTSRYQTGFLDLVGPSGPLSGVPLLTFSQDIAVRAEGAGSVLQALRFEDATSTSGLDAVTASGTTLSLGDYDGDGDEDVYAAGVLLRNDFGRFVDVTNEAGIQPLDQQVSAIFADYDNDGHLDLYITASGANRLYQNTGNGTFINVTTTAGVGDRGEGNASLFADFDHDGDLDMFLANTGENRLLQNNLDGRFTERAALARVAGGTTNSRGAAFADFDNDDDLDLFVVNEDTTNTLYSNLRQGQFEDVTAAVGLSTAEPARAVAAGDYDNDGAMDLFLTGTGSGSHGLYRNTGAGTFERDRNAAEILAGLDGLRGWDATFLDFDNDGFLDLIVAGATDAPGRGVRLFRNDGAGRFDDLSSMLPASLGSARRLAVGDYNEDGDTDIFVAMSSGAVRLLRNDGGNANHYLNVQLVGLSTGSGKNNHFGIGAKLEVRAGDLYQMRIVTGPITRFGLGQRIKADVVRVVWSNGVPHNLFYPGSDQDIVEQQTLKGSCGFLYAWNGNEFEFVTDVMWRSAIGMPMGIMAGTTSYAPPHASQEYLRIPADALQPKDGAYTIQITEELWEVAYFDEIRLHAVDHPDSVDIFVDERFVPPAPANLKMYQVAERRPPLSAVDQNDVDLLHKLRVKDNDYVDNMTPGRYQGLTSMHDLVLDLGDFAQHDSVTLFLNGWVFPTDASINVAVSQNSTLDVVFPYLQVMNAHGEWQTAVPDLSFPAGKNKTIVADLTGKFPTVDHRVRIRTNMEVYWDYVFFSVGSTAATVRPVTLELTSADLHSRGFSREYRKGGRYGPFWFDYNDVSTESRWLTMDGFHTRYGDVKPLLEQSDDRYIIMAAGDEVTLTFDATVLAPLPPGWTRDFLVYTDGWIKDADLNTATGDAVLPLPYHAMSQYPYGPGDAYPSDAIHEEFQRTYNTRWVGDKGRR